MSAVQLLAFHLHKLSGTLPSNLGHEIPILEEFLCGGNNLSGFISASISDSSRLRVLDLAGNSFKGLIPKSLGDNPLDGDLPASIGNLSNSLNSFEGNDCKLKGVIPHEIDYLQAWGSFKIIEFNVSSNLLSGHIPPEFGNLKTATLIDLSKNGFSGKIPSTLGGLDKLINLSLAHNVLDGKIPNSFGKLLVLEFLDLCYNNLSGEIPKSLEARVFLKYLNISFNELNGEIPTGGPFANVTSQSFLSNDALCGESWINVKPCLTKSTKKSRKRVLTSLYTLLGIGSLLALAVGYVLLRLRMTKKNASQADVSLELQKTCLTEVDRNFLDSSYLVIRDAEKMRVNVSWLRTQLNEINDAINCITETKKINDEMNRLAEQNENEKNLESMKVELEKLKSEIASRERQLNLETLVTEDLNSMINGRALKIQQFQNMLLIEAFPLFNCVEFFVHS
ncbi:hypothetical protein K7X08_023229 [Anisodus acutangulus]|uniref:Uncharacterized protein n=1 Tax=Anisodus acutangulus TaxID=402998 RepID=A0A9Q1LEV1_9SOLA|nr:hypothetical protein K7X08_023229 [Anisodus acutangulus]